MTDTLSPRYQALELAIRSSTPGAGHDTIVARAEAFHKYLGGTPAQAATGGVTAGKATTATAGAQTSKATAGAAAGAAKAGAQTAKPANAAAGKGAPAAAGAGKAATGKPANAAQRTAQTAGNKPQGGGAPSADTKDPKGNSTYQDVVNALQKVLNKPGDPAANKTVAYKILAEKGGKADAVKNLKPEYYDAVVKACEAAAKAQAAPEAEAADDFGQPAGAMVPDTSGAEGGEDPYGDPPEGGSGDPDADPTLGM